MRGIERFRGQAAPDRHGKSCGPDGGARVWGGGCELASYVRTLGEWRSRRLSRYPRCWEARSCHGGCSPCRRQFSCDIVSEEERGPIALCRACGLGSADLS
jgi:hypothetical protein